MRTLAAVAVALLLLAGCTSTPPSTPASTPPSALSAPPSAPSSTPVASAACGSPVRTGPLPEWARAGFSDDGSGVPQVYGAAGDIVAIIFGRPLQASPAPDRGNKILWVAREPVERGNDLHISAVLDRADVRHEQTVAGGPGPSLVDLPRAGCWHLTLTWGDHTDTLDLTYEP
ncbi:hypothetical protein [Actinoplanes sp. URMC 104]|uniref:hypothetical protein n=1 Tax=Actinoplanes sp. URMC 104 TaxID=3423409 RepID=UPI003F198552